MLAAKGFKVSYQSFKDRAAIYAAIDSGDANFYPEYAASGLEFLNGNKGEASSDAAATVAALQKQLDSRDLTALEPAEAIDTNSLVVTKDTADSKSRHGHLPARQLVPARGPTGLPDQRRLHSRSPEDVRPRPVGELPAARPLGTQHQGRAQER